MSVLITEDELDELFGIAELSIAAAYLLSCLPHISC